MEIQGHRYTVSVCVCVLTCVYSSPQAHTSRSWAIYLCFFSATFGRAALEEQLRQQMTLLSLNSFLHSLSLARSILSLPFQPLSSGSTQSQVNPDMRIYIDH